MARPLRIEYPDAVYHVMNRGTARQKVFLEKEDYENFLRLLEELRRRWAVQVFAYALMGNHYHLCLQTPEGNLSRVMRHLDGIYTQRFNRAHRRDGALFRGRYKAIVVEAEEYLGAVVRYIHLNPVEAGLVIDPRDYEWSSHKEYMNKKQSWVGKERLLKSLEGPKGFHEYVMAGNDTETDKFYKSKKRSPILGTEGFVEEMREKVKEVSSEVTKSEEEHFRPRLEEMLEKIGRRYKVNRQELEKGIRGRENEARQLAIYLACELCNLNQARVAEKFRVRSYKTISWHCKNVRERIANDRIFAQKVEILISELNN
ncbi:MAG: transposase [Chlamydiae bacterium]|nr:transposase [Chlamydiota bacterium]